MTLELPSSVASNPAILPTRPREGTTPPMMPHTFLSIWFQPAHPRRGATSLHTMRSSFEGFQPAHPRRGATRDELRSALHHLVSTRAPPWGCDSSCARATPGLGKRFNPLTPVGVRGTGVYCAEARAPRENPRPPGAVRP